ncbi:tripartite motif-containing protein 3-like [Amphiura filiformis]|uniref:tripartite motif-containing protein 3-like n=1 Tax=Amphiura filiformis TaxID=82378 RepID=UPI003B225ADC
MAASLSPVQRTEEFKDEFLTCSICAEPFDDDERKAKCLSCLHTYCKSCLQSIAGKQSNVNCPKCRKLITFPGETVDSLPNNFLVENLKEYQDILNSSIACDSCVSGQAVSFCHDCGASLCQKCVDVHSQLGILRHHKLSAMAELQKMKPIPIMQKPQHCTKHPKQDVTMYCTEANCKVPVCATCGLLDHQGHKLIELSAEIATIIDDMHKATAKLNETKKELEHKQLRVAGLQETITTNFKRKEKEMQESVQKLHDLIDANYNKANAHLKNLYETEMHKLTATIDSMKFLTAQISSACDFANQSCDMNHSSQLLISQNQTIERLNELAIAELPETASDKTDFDFTEKHHLAIAQIQELLQGLGDIRWKSQQCTIKLDLTSGSDQKRRAIVENVDSNGQRMIISCTNVEATQGGHSLHIQDNNDGTYAIEYDSHGRSLPLHVEVNGAEMTGSPFSTTPDVDPQRCTIRLGLPVPSGYGNMKAIVQTVDINGHKMTTGNAKVEAIQGRNLLSVQDNNDGTFTFDYDSHWGKQPSLPLQVKINGTEMKQSPFNTVPAEVDPEQCTIQLGLHSKYDNRKKAIVQPVKGKGSPFGEHNCDGTYTIHYRLYENRSCCHFHVEINGTAMKGSPFKFS